MTPTLAIELVRGAVVVALLVSAPLLLAALLTGVLVSLVQAITQLQEQTLTFIPKLLVVALVLVVTLPWTLRRLTEYLAMLVSSLPTIVAS